ncbi:hypothetical protein C8R48DRAFT_670328 [Suillus tomentosus]|nr:hypothetical protein C8R48DRAFT_670328 [Suillus tomentosus]
MFARIFAVASLVAFALANDECNTGNIQCCKSATSVENYNLMALNDPSLITIPADLVGLVGLDCSALTIVGGGAGCEANQEPMCCSNNKYDGVVNVGCTPINISP